MTDIYKAAQQALEALEGVDARCITSGYVGMDGQYLKVVVAAKAALRDALAEQPAKREPVAWKHDCAALLTNGVELWIDACPHCGKPRPAPQPAKREQGPVEIEMPEYHSHGMGCGLEDRGITDRYEAMEYGWYEAIDRVKEELASFGPLYTGGQP